MAAFLSVPAPSTAPKYIPSASRSRVVQAGRPWLRARVACARSLESSTTAKGAPWEVEPLPRISRRKKSATSMMRRSACDVRMCGCADVRMHTCRLVMFWCDTRWWQRLARAVACIGRQRGCSVGTLCPLSVMVWLPATCKPSSRSRPSPSCAPNTVRKSNPAQRMVYSHVDL